MAKPFNGPDFKPPPRVVDGKAGIEKLRREGRCRVCGRVPSGHPLDALNRFHLVGVGRKQDGDDLDENIVPVCGSGTTGCHGEWHMGGPAKRRVGVRLRVRLTPRERQYVIRKKGRVWFEAQFPARL